MSRKLLVILALLLFAGCGSGGVKNIAFKPLTKKCPAGAWSRVCVLEGEKTKEDLEDFLELCRGEVVYVRSAWDNCLKKKKK